MCVIARGNRYVRCAFAKSNTTLAAHCINEKIMLNWILLGGGGGGSGAREIHALAARRNPRRVFVGGKNRKFIRIFYSFFGSSAHRRHNSAVPYYLFDYMNNIMRKTIKKTKQSISAFNKPSFSS